MDNSQAAYFAAKINLMERKQTAIVEFLKKDMPPAMADDLSRLEVCFNELDADLEKQYGGG